MNFMLESIRAYRDLVDFLSSFLERTGEGERERLEESLLAGCGSRIMKKYWNMFGGKDELYFFLIFDRSQIPIRMRMLMSLNSKQMKNQNLISMMIYQMVNELLF